MISARNLILTTLSALALTACKVEPEPVVEDTSPQDTGGCVFGTDTDGDGLDDCEELELGTALHLADTDGDGFSDFREVVELGFSPENNNFKFNPRIADTPRIEVDITSPPSLALLYESSTGTEEVVEVTRSTESSNTVTTGKESTNSHSVEFAVTTGASVTTSASAGFPGGFSGSVEATVSFESSLATTNETSFTWSSEQSQENSEGFAEAEALAQSEGTSVSGGVIAVTVDVQNTGDIAYTLSNLVLSAYMSTPGREQVLSPVANLNFDTEFNAFPEFSYGPGQVNGPMVFLNDGLDTGTAQALLEDSTNLHLRVVAYELTDVDGRSFTHNQTDIMARTATIIVDYEGEDTLLDSERYQVATNIDSENLRITAWDAMTEILDLPYEMDENRELLSVRDVANNPEKNGYWTTVHISTDGLVQTVDVYNPDSADYDFGKLELKSGDVLQLIYVEDEDGDGLGRRQEKAYGTDLLVADSDGDGLLDGEEVNQTKSDPLSVDSDLDGIPDGEEVHTWGSDPNSADSDSDCIDDSLEVYLGSDPAVPLENGCREAGDYLYERDNGSFQISGAHWAENGHYIAVTVPNTPLTLNYDWDFNMGACSGSCYWQVYMMAHSPAGGEDYFDYQYIDTLTGSNTHSGSESFAIYAPSEPGTYYFTPYNYYSDSDETLVDWPAPRDFSEAVATLIVVGAD